MAAKVDSFDVIVVNSEFEALVLENSLIKRYKPHYNILLKDDKGYPFIRLDAASEYPRFSLVNRTAKDGAKYFGPFGARGQTKDIIDTVCKALRLPTCSRRFPRDIGKERPCLNYHMGACAGWCREGGPGGEEYRAAISEAELVLTGRTRELTESLTREMESAAEELRFELAASLRDRIRALEGLGSRQKVIAAVYADTDAVGFFRGAKSCFTVLHYLSRNLAAKDFELMDEPLEGDGEAVSALVRQYYSARGAWPRFILLPECVEGGGPRGPVGALHPRRRPARARRDTAPGRQKGAAGHRDDERARGVRARRHRAAEAAQDARMAPEDALAPVNARADRGLRHIQPRQRGG